MTEFEQATLAHQTATLAVQQVALWVAAVNAVAAFVSAGAHTVVAVAIWRGVREMDRDNEAFAAIRDRQREADERRHKKVMAEIADPRRHDEAMTKADQRHDEAMTEGARRHEENMAELKALIGGLERRMASLEAVVERTAPNRGAAE